MPITIKDADISQCNTAIRLSHGVDVDIQGLKVRDCVNGIVVGEDGTNFDIVAYIKDKMSSDDREEIIENATSLLSANDKKTGMPFYERLMSLAADHATVFAPIAPLLRQVFERLTS